jgi:mRNA interferase RelE/StbE
MYNIAFDEEAIDFLKKLPRETRRRVYNKIISSKANPFHYFERLEGRKEFKLRAGDYRIIADIDVNSKKIEIVLVGHRKNVYKK